MVFREQTSVANPLVGHSGQQDAKPLGRNSGDIYGSLPIPLRRQSYIFLYSWLWHQVSLGTANLNNQTTVSTGVIDSSGLCYIHIFTNTPTCPFAGHQDCRGHKPRRNLWASHQMTGTECREQPQTPNERHIWKSAIDTNLIPHALWASPCRFHSSPKHPPT